MSASQMALRGHIAQLEQDNIELRIALARTTKQLAETLEEYKLLRVPFFRRWRMRRLLKRRAAEQMKAITAQPVPVEQPQATTGDMLGARLQVEELKTRSADVVPLIIVPGR